MGATQELGANGRGQRRCAPVRSGPSSTRGTRAPGGHARRALTRAALAGVAALVGWALAACGPTSGAIAAPATVVVPPSLGSGTRLRLDVHFAGDVTQVGGYDLTTHALVRSLDLAGRFLAPTVTSAGPPEGTSRDGGVVVLVQDVGPSTSPPKTVRFAVLDGGLQAPARIIELPGAFSYDALSPDGSRLYLVEHLPPAGSEHYQVRVYDLAAERLDDAVIADKARVAEWMAGHPTSRATSPDGSIVATTYERAGGAPFVHVLHTVDGWAQCVDLPASAAGLRLAWTGDALTLRDAAGRQRLAIDPTTAEVTQQASAG